LPLIKNNNHEAWHDKFKACAKIEYEKVIHHDLNPTSKGLNMSEIVAMLSDQTNGAAIVVPDVGQHQMIAGRYYRYTTTDGWATSGGLGTMGYALPASLGCKMAAPNRQVVAIIGDGCFQMNIQELGTINQTGAAVKIIIMNNGFLGMVRQWQELFFDRRYSFTELHNPDFITIAKGYGIKGRTISKREELAAALQEMLDSPSSYVLECIVEREVNVFPMIASGTGVGDILLE